MAVNRVKFIKLGGFNTAFYPAYHEDVELCFRAWRRGWRCIYEPRSIVWHRENASWSESPLSRSNRLHIRNALLFQWAFLPKSLSPWRMKWSLLKLMIAGCLKFDFTWISQSCCAAISCIKLKNQKINQRITMQELNQIKTTIAQPVHII